MTKLVLERPAASHEARAEEFKKEFFDNDELVINGSALFDRMTFSDWLERSRRSMDPESTGSDWVPASTFFAVRESDGKIVGMIDIRHNLDHAFLAQYGGHIGFAVRPGERCKGYAYQMLRRALEYAKSIGLPEVMLGSYADNTASIRTIRKCGGMLTETKPYTDGKPMNVYWITLK